MGTFELRPRTVPPAELAPGQHTLTVRAGRPVGECYRFWTVGNFNRTHVFLDAASRRRIAATVPLVREANLVYLLGGRLPDYNVWVRGAGPDGRLQTDFSGMIAQIRAALDAGYTPWPVLDNVPPAISSSSEWNFYGNTAPPRDEREWHQYVQAAVQAMVDAFGRRRVGSWWFRVGTEPDLAPEHWSGTREQYLAHYDFTVDAVTSVLPDAHIGPGNILNPCEREYRVFDKDQRGLDIIDHAARGANACTGRRGTRMTWFSYSWYSFMGVPIEIFDRAHEAVRSRLCRHEEFAGLPVLVGEYAVLCDEQGRRIHGGDTTEWSASFQAALADRVYRRGIRKVYEWAEATEGLLHPRAQVLAMLDRMAGCPRLTVEVRGEPAVPCGAIACRKDEDLLLLVYHHRNLTQPRVLQHVRLVVEDPRMKAGRPWRMSEWTLDAEHGVWGRAYLADCEAAGLRPQAGAYPFEGSVERLFGEEARAAGMEVLQRNRAKYTALAAPALSADGAVVPVGPAGIDIDLDMPSHSVRFIRLSPS